MVSGESRMGFEPRGYRDETDLHKMFHLLVEGRRANNGSYYVHVGDLSWWLFYVEPGADPGQYIYVWGGDGESSALSGWALLSPEWRTFDVVIHPDLRGSRQAQEMLAWAEGEAARIARWRGQAEIRTMWVAEGDDDLIAHLERRGFARRDRHMILYGRSLKGKLPAPELAPGFQVRRLGGEREAPARAAASHAAFESSWAMDRYVQRTLAFMRSPVYRPELDIVAVAPEGGVAAFCNGWLDFTNRVGYFEPVGAHPDFRGMGLAKGVMIENLRRMSAYGMRTVSVCAEHDNAAAQHLYPAVGFQPLQRLLTYAKPV